MWYPGFGSSHARMNHITPSVKQILYNVGEFSTWCVAGVGWGGWVGRGAPGWRQAATASACKEGRARGPFGAERWCTRAHCAARCATALTVSAVLVAVVALAPAPPTAVAASEAGGSLPDGHSCTVGALLSYRSLEVQGHRYMGWGDSDWRLVSLQEGTLHSWRRRAAGGDPACRSMHWVLVSSIRT